MRWQHEIEHEETDHDILVIWWPEDILAVAVARVVVWVARGVGVATFDITTIVEEPAFTFLYRSTR